MNLNEKIKRILTDKNISPSRFADEIGIQRSSVSHILAGRNKPSLDIVQKVIRRFPELGMNWILDDEDLPEIEETIVSVQREPRKSETKKLIKDGALESHTENISNTIPVASNLKEHDNPLNSAKKIDRVMIFYSDGTFQEYKQ